MPDPSTAPAPPVNLDLPSLAPAGGGDLAALAAETIRDSESAVVRPSSTPGPVQASGPVDSWGRAFDPALHKVRADGTPQLRKSGVLILKDRSLAPFGQRLAPKDRPATGGDFLDTAPAGLPDPGAAPGPGVQVPGVPGTEPAPLETEPPVTMDEARMDAQAVADAMEMVGQAANPDEGSMKDPERGAIETRWANVFMRYQLRLPVGQIALAMIASGKYVGRLAVLPKTRERTQSFFAWIMGRERPQPAPSTKPQHNGNQPQPANPPRRAPQQIFEDTGL